MNRVFALPENKYTEQKVNHVIRDVLEEENATYKTYCEIITNGQLKLLKAIAMEKRVLEPFEAGFMRQYNLKATGSVRLALQSLVQLSFFDTATGDFAHADGVLLMVCNVGHSIIHTKLPKWNNIGVS